MAGELQRPLRLWLLRAISVLVGLAAVGGCELLLRAVPGLRPPPLAVTLAQRDGRTLKAIEPRYAQRFFAERYGGALVASGRMASTPFVEIAGGRQQRPRRVVVAGASTVQGYPHARRLAAASFLEAMMNDASPGRPVQVLNLGITSIASYAVARLVEDALALEPDLMVVYSGHNEFYGLYGGGTELAPSLQALRYRLGLLRLGVLAERLVGLVQGDSVLPQSLLETMAARGRVAPADPRRTRAAAALAANLASAAAACRRRGVPLIVCTVAANDSGFAPAATLPPATALLGARRDELFGRVIAGLDSAAASAVLADAEALLQEMPEDALLHYVAGCAAAAAGRRERALAGFRQARDLDPMPWRAPTAHNEAIRALAARSDGVILADVERAFAAAAGGQGVGWALMADHVHPTVQGQIVLARCVLAAAAAALPAWEWDLGRVRDDGYYRELLGDVPVERVGVEEAMAELLGSPPMAEFNAHNAARLRRQAQAGWAALTPAERRGARRWQSHRELAPLALEVADELFQAGDLCRARWHYSAAQREAPYTARGDLWAAMHWGWAVQLANGALTAAERDTLASALERTAFVALAPAMDGDYIAMVRGVLLHLLQRHDEALPELERAFASRTVRGQFVYSFFPALASELVAAGRVQDARTRAQQAAADGNPYFADLVETLAAGGRVGPPTASRSHPAQGTDPCRADTRR